MANLSYKNDEQADERLDPASVARNLKSAEESSAYSGAGIDQAEAFANDPANATKDQEENPNSINYTGSGNSGGSKEKTTFSFRGQLKKKGPIGAIVALLLGGGGGLFMLFTPGLAVIQIKEVLTDDLNDQLGAMDIRTTKVFKAKLNDFGKPLSACTVKIRCGFKGMSDRQIKKFEAAGIEVETVGDKNPLTRKTGVKSLSLTDSTGKTITVNDPTKLNKMLGDRVIRNTLRKAFNPKFAGFYDNVSAKVFSRFRTSKAEKVTGDTDEQRDKSVNDAVAGEKGTTDTSRIATSKDANGNDVDADGNIITPDEAANAGGIAADQASRLSGGGTSTKSLFASVAKNGAKSLAKGLLITGAADTACSVKNASRAVESTAKVVRAAQLARFAMVFLTFADQVKAGTATPEQAEYIGNKLTAVDTDKEVLNETAKSTDEKVKNPDYGKNAFDSDGFKVASYNDAPDLSARSMAYTVGGTGLMGTLSSVNSFMQNTLGGKSCKVIQNNFVRLGSLVVGIGVGAISLGASFYAQAGASIAIGMALPILENYLANMLAGTVVDAKTDGVDAGNAVFAGTAAIDGGTAAGRGMKPQNKSELKEYLATTKSINDEYIAMETNDAKKMPFDVYNQYSFLGSFARKIIPATAASSTNISSSVATIPQLFSTAATSVLPNAKAVGVFNEERFSKCDDDGYKELGIDADVFCNVRYGMSAKELAMDTDEVVDYMINNRFIDGNTGAPLREEYSRFLNECVNRTVGWGEDQGENSGTGKFCMDDNTMMSNFRVYTMDSSINEAMEYEGPQSGPGTAVMSFNILGAEQGARNNNDGNMPWKTRADAAISIIQQYQPSILGLQEVNDVQFDYIKPRLAGYDSVPGVSKGPAQPESILWNSAVFTAVDKGTYTYPKNGGTSTAVWVKLQSLAGGGYVYAFNAHPTAQSDSYGPGERKRVTNIIIDQIKKANTDNSPVVLTGDFNATSYLRGGDGGASVSDLPSSLLVAAGFTDARDIAAQKTNEDYQSSHGDAGKAREKDNRSDMANKIDHVFVSNGITVNTWENVISDDSRIASDHTPIVANLSIPGISAGTTGGEVMGNLPSKEGWVWPVPGVNSLGILRYGARGSKGIHKGIDIGKTGGSTLGKSVVAAHDGIVNRVWGQSDSCGAYISIQATGTNYYAAYQHVNGASITVKAGQPVKAGQVIAKVGKQGGSTCGSVGFFHLHFSIESKPGMVSAYADGFPNGTVDPLKVLPR